MHGVKFGDSHHGQGPKGEKQQSLDIWIDGGIHTLAGRDSNVYISSEDLAG